MYNSNNLLLDVGQATHIGKIRKENEDSLGWFTTKYGELFIIADGMGGHQGGAAASKCAVQSWNKYFNLYHGTSEEMLLGGLKFSEKAVHNLGISNPEYYGCGSTIVALLINNNCAWYIHAGDSRLYILSDGRLNQIGRDHSVVEDMLEIGLINSEEAKNYPKNVITQSLGGNIDIKRCLPKKILFSCGECFLLCTDGLWNVVEKKLITKCLTSNNSAQTICDQLINLTLKYGAPDNVSMQIIKILGK